METAAAPQGAGASRRLLALARDPQLCQALQDLDNTAPPLHLTDNLASLTDELMKHGAAIVLLDAAALDTPIEAVVDALNAQFPDLLLMVAGHGSEQTLLASRISEQAVFRFVHKPASHQRLRLFMDAAARAAPRRDGSFAATAAAARPLRAGASPGAGGSAPSGFRISAFHIGIVALVLAVVTAWLLWPQPSPPAPAAVVIDPAREQALAVEQALRTAEAALLSGNLPEAAAATEQARALQPENPRVAFLAAQLEREHARAAADAAQQQAEDTSQAQLRAALARMSERLRAGDLLEPLEDSAAAHFRDARKIAPEDPAVLIARDALIAAMLTSADQNLTAGRIGDARQLVDVSARLHPSAPGLDLIRSRIREAQATQAAAATPAAPAPAPAASTTPAPVVQAPAPVEPPAPNPVVTAAPPAASPAKPAPAARDPAPVSTSSLKLVRRVEAKYPERAWEQQISGWVELEFIVTAQGTTRDIRVTASEPSRVFDAAAIAALRRYRYEPVLSDGRPVELTARMRMRFTPQSKD